LAFFLKNVDYVDFEKIGNNNTFICLMIDIH